VYTISSISWFGFENGIFTGISGSGAIPTVITFSKNQSGEYLLLEYKEPMDGAGYSQSIKKMFPKKLWDKVFTTEKYPEITKQMEAQAKDYLQSIGRISKVSLTSVEKKPVNINVEASNTIFAEYTKYDSELNKFPYWIGSKEIIENENRYIFETSQGKTNDGYDLITFKKIKEDGNVVTQYQYKIIGNKVHLLVND
jgi:bla regulator protein BlaR1